ncbi:MULTISPECIES: Coenzyme F420 hydrogenase/dehydrogenase, beta subunit C-terminal domain [unclassified Clostridium]|uniref:Coenzyme F420 hydrogenase/dehydrogenase, beta subunit C-terminal domain n=1 Tax=unclassified Clostridium TaxID=2614128 RepID=UPI000297EF51|nr:MULTISPECIES: Coenzyme F420 hydrogenase/dehydrogenase, beta subunit C-terminal domain [unclassified Clostridium]EKQ56963.1 MAG: coenzyme F420-reducing hydrogenase, beta subunit [Clostridium sp. Maddingley MBC34-26]
MIDYEFELYCCGCKACSAACPVNTIKMIEDKNGFEFPQVDKEKCINCGKCNKVCPHYHGIKKNKPEDVSAWLYCSDDTAAKKRSSSGGAFFELAKQTLSKGGYVCGCEWDDSLVARHTISNSEEDLQKMQGSKYVQSNLGDIYQKVLSVLKEGKEVLFSGTPCQITAMHNYISNSGNGALRERLINVAVICHGISAPGVWESYKVWLENKYNSKLIAVNFRDKSKDGYKKSNCRYEFASGEIIYLPTYLPSSKYIEAALVYNLSLRNSCSHCDCKGITETCDIILGDWYAEHEGEGSLGTSCIAAFTEKGEKIVSTRLLGLRPLSYSKIVQENEFIENSVTMGLRHDEFLQKHNVEIWDKVETYFPTKYKVKKLFILLGIYSLFKKIKTLI